MAAIFVYTDPMRNLDLSDYPVEVYRDGKFVEEPYRFTRSLIGILFMQEGLSADLILERDDIARKIKSGVATGTILLEENEYKQILGAVNAFRSYGQNDVELVRRVRNAPQVDVKVA